MVRGLMSDEEWAFFAPFVIEGGPRRRDHRLVLAEPGPEPRVLLGDKGYEADAILADPEDRGIAAVIPPRRNRKVQPIIDGHLHALRNHVEPCFSMLKRSRRLATCYDKTADSYLGFILVASARPWVRNFVNRT